MTVRGVAQPGRALALGARCREFESRRPDHLRFDGISAHIFHGPKYSTRKRGGRFPLLLTRCGDHLPTADRSGAAAFSGAARRTRAARFLRLGSNELQNGAPVRISEVGGGVGRSARAARPPRRASWSDFFPACSERVRGRASREDSDHPARQHAPLPALGARSSHAGGSGAKIAAPHAE